MPSTTQPSGAPILVTGAHRSGTTWVGAMLALGGEIGLVHEPFSPLTGPGVRPVEFERFFEYVCPDNAAAYEGLVRTVELRYDLPRQLTAVRTPAELSRAVGDWRAYGRARRAGLRPLLKDPIAFFSAEWLADRFSMDVVVLVRHPAAFVSSLNKLGWTHDFSTFLDQPLLMRDHLAPFEEDVRRQAAQPGDPIEQGILLWRIIYSTALGYRERHPDWLFRRHEDLSLAPEPGFEELYGRLGLRLDEPAREGIRNASAEGNPTENARAHDVHMDSRAAVRSWHRRLEPAQIEAIRKGTSGVWEAFYTPDDWNHG